MAIEDRTHAREVQERRIAAGKPGYAKAVKAWAKGQAGFLMAPGEYIKNDYDNILGQLPQLEKES